MLSERLKALARVHGPIIGLFFLITLLYMSPVFLDGKALPQNDVKQWQGSSQEINTHFHKTGNRSLWTGSMFGGMPTYQISPHTRWGLVGLSYIYSALVSSGLPIPANALFAYMLGMYLLCLAFGVRPWIAAFGALAYAFSTYNIVILAAGHMSKAYALAVAPMWIAAAVYTLKTRHWLLGGVLFGITMAWQLRSNHPQITYYFGIVLALYLLIEGVRMLKAGQGKQLFRAGAVMAFFALVAVGTGATGLLTTSEYTSETIRGKSDLAPAANTSASNGLDKDYAFQWSNGIGESWTLLMPDVKGGASRQLGEKNKGALKGLDQQAAGVVSQMDQYWGDQPFTSGPVYFGAGVIALFLVGLITLRNGIALWAGIVFVLGLMLSWGKNYPGFNDFFFDFVPLYNKFRSVNMTLVISSLVVPLIGAIAAQRLIEDPTLLSDKKRRQPILIGAGIVALLCVIFYLAPSVAGDFLKPNGGDEAQLTQANFEPQAIPMVIDGLAEARTSILQADALRSLLFVLLTAACFFAWILSKRDNRIVYGGLIAVTLLDLAMVDRRYLESKDFKRKKEVRTIQPGPADLAILQDKDLNYRVMNLGVSVFNDASTSYFHKSVGGYHGAKLRRFQEFRETYLDQIDGIIRQNIAKIPAPQLLAAMQNDGSLGPLNMMNVRYLITDPRSADGVVRNPNALGNAWLVKGIRKVQSADEELASFKNLNIKDTAVADVSRSEVSEYLGAFQPGGAPEASITLTKYEPDQLTYSFNSSKDELAVFSEVYYNSGKGWEAYLDGKPVPHTRVNFLLRGLKVPSGKHEILFKFEPKSYKRGETISLIASLLLLGALPLAIYVETKRKREIEVPVRDNTPKV